MQRHTRTNLVQQRKPNLRASIFRLLPKSNQHKNILSNIGMGLTDTLDIFFVSAPVLFELNVMIGQYFSPINDFSRWMIGNSNVWEYDCNWPGSENRQCCKTGYRTLIKIHLPKIRAYLLYYHYFYFHKMERSTTSKAATTVDTKHIVVRYATSIFRWTILAPNGIFNFISSALSIRDSHLCIFKFHISDGQVIMNNLVLIRRIAFVLARDGQEVVLRLFLFTCRQSVFTPEYSTAILLWAESARVLGNMRVRECYTNCLV